MDFDELIRQVKGMGGGSRNPDNKRLEIIQNFFQASDDEIISQNSDLNINEIKTMSLYEAFGMAPTPGVKMPKMNTFFKRYRKMSRSLERRSETAFVNCMKQGGKGDGSGSYTSFNLDPRTGEPAKLSVKERLFRGVGDLMR